MAQNRDPAGDIKRAEDARNNEQAWALLLDLEDVDWLHEQDKVRIIEFVTRAAARIKSSRTPCGFFDRLFKRGNCDGKLD